jgi:predicted amidophosphoribosyltransferase
MAEENKGWQCCVCKKVWAPDVKFCQDCVKEESQPKDERQLLIERKST